MTTFRPYAVVLLKGLEDLAELAARDHSVKAEVAHNAILRELKALLPLQTYDHKATFWRARVMLFDRANGSPFPEPDADSDEGKPLAAPGSEVCHGLPEVAKYLNELATTWHAGRGETLTGLDIDTLMHSTKSLRPTLSRRGGRADWRVTYTVHRAGMPCDWMAVVNVERVSR